MSGRRIELSATQLIASVAAAVTGAVAASYLGVAGTIIGAGVVSFCATAGTAVYRHYLARTEEKLRAAAAQLPHPNARAGSHQPAVPGSPVLAPRPERADVRQRAGVEERAGAPERANVPGRHRLASENPGPYPAADAAAWNGDPAGTAALDPAGTAAPDPAGQGKDPRPAVAGGRAGRATAARPGRPRWLTWAGFAIGIFLLTMAAITVFEAATGRPLEATIWGRHGSGTTIGDVVTGDTGPGTPPTRPARRSSERATAPATQGATPPTSPSAAPTTEPATPTPSPTGSPEPTPSDSAGTSSPSPPAG